MTLSLFGDATPSGTWREELVPGAVALRGFAVREETAVIAALRDIQTAAPFRRMITPGGFRMSVAMTNCGAYGWVTDRSGYRYDGRDPESGKPWPRIPTVFFALAQRAAADAGFDGFEPDSCLINRYEPGARMSLHQDKNERDFTQPIVSVSLGVPAMFLFGGLLRSDKARRIPLMHGDVVVWGGLSRMRYHGVLPIRNMRHPLLGNRRFNLTFRKAA